MAVKKLTYEKLCQKLGELDRERRTILQQLRNSPEHITKHLNDKLTEFVNKQLWFTRSNAKGENAYFKLRSYTIDNKKINNTKHGAVLIHVILSWDYYDYAMTEKKIASEPVVISAFNEIDTQVLNGRVHAPNFSEKDVLKTILTKKKADLEAQLKAIKSEIASI